MTRARSNFASLSAGPGNGLASTSTVIQTQERDFVEQAHYKGCTYRIGDYVHLVNPDDATKPIIGQVYRIFTPHGYARFRFAIVHL